MKNIFISLILLLIAAPGFYSLAQSPQNPAEKIAQMENRFRELDAQIITLEMYNPEKSPDFQELEKINQLVEELDFNRRKFDLLIKQYNVLEDELFPFLLDYYTKNPGQKNEIFAKLQEYTSQENNNILLLQEKINTVALQMERLEKRIEWLQLTARDKALSEDKKQKTESETKTADISSELVRLQEEKKNIEIKLNDEETKKSVLEKKKTEREAKILEKQKEIDDLHIKIKAASDSILRLLHTTSANVRQIRLNGLEIPRLNALKTFLYLSDTTINTLKDKMENIDKEIHSLEEQQKGERLRYIFDSAKAIAIALALVFLILYLARRGSRKILSRLEGSEKIETHRKQRYQTLSSVILSFINVFVWVMAVLWVLGQMKIDYAPFLVAAGGVSLAIGFGAQSLVKDVVSGFFILMEEQFALGDFVEINGVTGTVEKISLRTIKFRSLDGTLHIIPNGSISKVANQTYQWSRAVVTVKVGYNEEPRKVLGLLQSISEDFFADPGWKDKLMETPTPQGIIALSDSSVDYRILAKTIPGQQWAVSRELYIRVKTVLDRSGIEFPYQYINIIDRSEKNK